MDGLSVSLGSKLSNAKVSFAIFKRDIKRLLVNPVALVVTLGVCVIPSLYAWYNIVANWDPYGNTQGIKIAIANNDQGTQNDLVGELNAGDKVVDQLKENDQLGWTFVDSAADAKEGVESGCWMLRTSDWLPAWFRSSSLPLPVSPVQRELPLSSDLRRLLVPA